jgi:hypothetical protein
LASGKVKAESPLMKFNSESGVEDLQALADKLKEEVWQYVFKAKRANDLFADLPPNERGIDADIDDDGSQPEEVVKKANKSRKTPVVAGLNVA